MPYSAGERFTKKRVVRIITIPTTIAANSIAVFHPSVLEEINLVSTGDHTVPPKPPPAYAIAIIVARLSSNHAVMSIEIGSWVKPAIKILDKANIR